MMTLKLAQDFGKQYMYKRDIDWQLVEKADADLYAIKLLSGKYSDIIYTYGRVGAAEEENEDGNFVLSFDWKLEYKPEDMEEDLANSAEFQQYIGDILRDIIIDGYEYESREHTDDHNQEANTE